MTSYGLQATSYELLRYDAERATSYELQATSYELRVGFREFKEFMSPQIIFMISFRAFIISSYELLDRNPSLCEIIK